MRHLEPGPELLVLIESYTLGLPETSLDTVGEDSRSVRRPINFVLRGLVEFYHISSCLVTAHLNQKREANIVEINHCELGMGCWALLNRRALDVVVSGQICGRVVALNNILIVTGYRPTQPDI
jgi:hypothetical protein